MLAKEFGQVVAIENRMVGRAVNRYESSSEFSPENRFDSRAAILEDVIMDENEPRRGNIESVFAHNLRIERRIGPNSFIRITNRPYSRSYSVRIDVRFHTSLISWSAQAEGEAARASGSSASDTHT